MDSHCQTTLEMEQLEAHMNKVLNETFVSNRAEAGKAAKPGPQRTQVFRT